MKLDAIKISGYKSIDNAEIPLRKYGNCKSYTTIFLGKNETGKSNTLDAIATPISMDSGLNTSFLSIRTAQTEPEKISISYVYDINSEDTEIIDIIDNTDMPKEIKNNLRIYGLTKTVCLEKGNSIFNYNIDILFNLSNLNINDYCISKSQDYALVNNIEGVGDIIVKRLSEIEKDATDQYVTLTYEKFKDLLVSLLKTANQSLPLIDYWRPDQDYLIHDSINLGDFAETLSNVPLRNIFYLVGLKTQEEIREKILDISNNHKELLKFANKISMITTRYINERWSELPINIYVDIDYNLVMHIYVRDNTDNLNVFSMDDRSQGFKQFISILLSLSIDNTSGKLRDHIILLDEPEVHLHPSGVRWLRKELLEIGKNNYLFVATHSVFMLDRETKERHFLFSKDKKNLTKIQQIQTDDDINSDEILSQAFGINVLTDFISPHRLLVEGMIDKEILQKALDKVHKNHGVMISKGTGCNLPAVASYLEYYNVDVMVVVDDDIGGREIKERIIKHNKNNKVFTIRDLNNSIVSGGSIEDTLPVDYVMEKANQILKKEGLCSCTLNDNKPVVGQLLLHLQKTIQSDNSNIDKKNKINEIIAEIKINLSKYEESKITKELSPRLVGLAERILSTLGIK